MNVLVIGSGGREHALCWSLAASPLIDDLFCAPGSSAIAEEAKIVAIAVDDIDGIVDFCREREINLVFPGPELPLVLGVANRLEEARIKCFGPSAAGSASRRLEGVHEGFRSPPSDPHGCPRRLFTRPGR